MTRLAEDIATTRAWFSSLGSQHVSQWMQPGARAFFVRSSAQSGMDATLAGQLVPSIKAAFALCRASANDVIFVLPGHTENVDSAFAANMVAGTKVVGLGSPDESNAPTLSWNAAASTWAVDVANVTIAGLRLQPTHTSAVTEGIGVTAAGFKFLDNYVVLASTAAVKFTDFIDLESGANNATIKGNQFYGVTAGEVANVIDCSAAVAKVRIIGNTIVCATSHATNVAPVNFADVVHTDLLVCGNLIANRKAVSTGCIALAGTAAMTGNICDNRLEVLVANGAATAGILRAGGAGALVKMYENYVCDADGLVSGVIAPAAT